MTAQATTTARRWRRRKPESLIITSRIGCLASLPQGRGRDCEEGHSLTGYLLRRKRAEAVPASRAGSMSWSGSDSAWRAKPSPRAKR